MLARTLGPKGGGLGSPTSIGEGNECERGGWVQREVDCEIPHRLERRRKHSLKTLRENLIEKAERGQYLLAVGLECFSHCMTTILVDVNYKAFFDPGGCSQP